MENGNFSATGQQTGTASGASKKRTAKQWVLFGIILLTVLFVFVGLAFPVAHFEVTIFGSKLADTTVLGFDILIGHMPNALESVYTVLMAFVWLQLIAVLPCLILAIMSITKLTPNMAKRTQTAVMIVSLVFAFVYMLDGVIALSASEIKGTTASYALLIVVVLLTIGYFVCRKVLPENGSKRPKQGKGSAGGESVADQIKKYKELYDMGAITQEEYERKKAELLKG